MWRVLTQAYVFLGGCTLVGLYLLVRGLVGRRKGNEPRCRKCGYNLTGLASEQCPECGADFDSATVDYGVRRRRPAALVTGIVLLVFAGGMWGISAYHVVRGISLYQSVPFFYVLADAQTSQRGLREIERRVAAKVLSAGQIHDLADICLELQRRDPTPPQLGRWLDVLDGLDAGGRLSKEQQNRYYDQLVAYSLQVRPEIRQGDPVAFQVVCKERGPEGELVWCAETVRTIKVGDRTAPRGSGGESAVGVWESSSASTVEFDGLRPGKHVVQVALAYDLTRGGLLLASRDMLLSAETTVLPAGAMDSPPLNTDPTVREALERCISLESIELVEKLRTIHRRRMQPQKEYFWQLNLRVRASEPLPVDVAFDVIIHAGDEEFHPGTIKKAKGSRPVTWIMNLEVPDPSVDQVQVVLRSNPQLIWTTVDVFECWDGELIFGPVELPRRYPFRPSDRQTTQPRLTTSAASAERESRESVLISAQ